MTTAVTEFSTPTLLSIGANLALLVAVAWSTRVWIGRDRRRRRKVAWSFALAALGSLAYFGLSSPADFPASWYTPLQEGNSLQTLSGLHGRSAHAGGNFRGVLELLSGRPYLRAGDLMRCNVWLSAVATLLFAALATELWRSRWAALLATLVFALNRNSVDAAVSDLPGPLLSCYLLLGTVAVAAYWQATARKPLKSGLLARWVPIVTVLVLAVLAAWTRIETVLFGAFALTSLVLHELAGPARLRGFASHIRRVFGAAVARPYLLWVVVFALFAIPWWSDPESDQARWLLDTAWPLNLSPVLLFFRAPDVLPVAAVVLAGAGFVDGFRRPIRTAGAALVGVLLWKLYYSAGHGFRFELHRYMTMLVPMLMILALLGGRALVQWSQQLALSKVAQRACVVALLALLFVDSGYGIKRQAYQHEQQRRLMQGNLQLEARWMLMHTRNYPDCIFVAPVQRRSDSQRWSYLLFGRPLREPIELAASPTNLASELRRIAGSRCVLRYRGRDCFLRDGPSCDAHFEGAVVVDQMRLESRPYNHYHFGVAAPFLDLALYAAGDGAGARKQNGVDQ